MNPNIIEIIRILHYQNTLQYIDENVHMAQNAKLIPLCNDMMDDISFLSNSTVCFYSQISKKPGKKPAEATTAAVISVLP